MSSFNLIKGSCADQTVDIIVNAANRNLLHGAGICGVIFEKAGLKELQAACNEHARPLKDGEAAITPAFNLTNAQKIIHAVGPNFNVTKEAYKELYMAYYNSLLLMKENEMHSISFPLISSGIFGGSQEHPAAESTKEALLAYKDFITNYPDYDIDMRLCAFTDKEMEEALNEYKKTL